MSISKNVAYNFYRGPADQALGGISLVLPVRNESFIIEQTIKNYHAELNSRVCELEIVVAEDGSTDDTKAILERIEQELPIKLFMSNERKGYQRALIDAVSHATKEWVFLVDSDYQFAAIDFWRLEPLRSDYDIILGKKSPRRDPFYRIWLSAGYNFLMRVFLKVPYQDMDTGFRLIKREALVELAAKVSHMSFFTAEFVVRAHHAGYKVVEVPVPHYERKIGSTSIFFISSLFGICLKQFLGILSLRRELKRDGIMDSTRNP